MSGVTHANTIRKLAVAGALVLGVNTAFANDNAGSPMTAGLVMDKMPVRERFSYVAGIVEGLAYARFRKDTAAKGGNDVSGMKCIYDWFYTDNTKTMDTVEAAFRKYADRYPATLLAVLIKRKCGE